MTIELRDFNRHYPYHHSLDFIADRENVKIGKGRFNLNKYEAFVMFKNGLINVSRGKMGHEVSLTRKGRHVLGESRMAFRQIR